MKSLVARHDLSGRIEVDSAGTAAYHVGERPDRRSREAARRRGIALDSRARQFTVDDFARHDYVLAMDRENLAHLEALRAGTDFAGHLRLLRDFDALAARGAEVPDPYYAGDAGFEEVLDLCEAACLGLIQRIQRDWER